MTFKSASNQNLIQTLILLKVLYVLMHIKVILLQEMMLLNIRIYFTSSPKFKILQISLNSNQQIENR
jgi:hypothetical protein